MPLIQSRSHVLLRIFEIGMYQQTTFPPSKPVTDISQNRGYLKDDAALTPSGHLAAKCPLDPI